MRWLAVLLFATTLWSQTGPEAEQVRQAGALVVAGHPEQAIAIYQNLVREYPRSVELRMNLCIAEFKAKRYRESVEDAKAALKLRPALPTANLFLGASYVELGENAAAIPPLRKMLEVQPDDRNAQLMLAEALSGTKAYKEAAAQFQRLSERIPDNPKVWYGLGQSYEGLARSDVTPHQKYGELARQAYDRLMQLPPSREAYVHRAELDDQRAQWVQAAKHWREALSYAPDDPRIRAGLVWAEYRARDYESALSLLGRMQDDAPHSVELNFLTGACWVNLEQPEKGLPYLYKAVSLDPRFLPAQAALGHGLLRMGRAREALPHLKAALPIDEDGTGHFQLFRAYQLAGDATAAKQALAAYQEFTKRLPVAANQQTLDK